MIEPNSDMGNEIGLIGLAVMGQNLVLNMERHGFRVGVFNRTTEVTRSFVEGTASGKNIQGYSSVEELIASLRKPRAVMLMVKAGNPVDAVIEQLKPHLDSGDLIIDGGNSFFLDTERRSEDLAQEEINFIGVGISGGEEGALWGPSIMPGGQREAYERVESIYEAIAAKVEGDPCVTYIGPRGSGHYVKMVHNGIEYGVMQLIAESYDLLRRGLGLSAEELGEVYRGWNQGPLASFLIEITAEIFHKKDKETGKPLVEVILDKASQKGTGKWTSQEALDLGVPIPTISAAVEARSLSAYKTEREAAAQKFPELQTEIEVERDEFVSALGEALYASTLITYIQGMELLKAASQEYEFDLDLSDIARIWRGGCIIRARLLEDIRRAFKDDPELPSLILAPKFKDVLSTHHEAWQKVVATAAGSGIPIPAMGSALAYFDSYRSARLPANLIQAQRDYFGAHTYERIDKPGKFHSEWKEK
jgi:6-phosphogluconate dehydrogenase